MARTKLRDLPQDDTQGFGLYATSTLQLGTAQPLLQQTRTTTSLTNLAGTTSVGTLNTYFSRLNTMGVVAG